MVNLGLGSYWTRVWSSAVMVGTAEMLFSFPHLGRAEANRPRRFSAFWAAWTLFPLGGAVLLLTLDDYGLILIFLGLAFLPFWASIFYGLALTTPPNDQPSREGWVVFLILLSLGGVEVWWIMTHPPQADYYFVTLPLAPPAVPLELKVPEALGGKLGLTAREAEMASGILRRLSNKELAYELGLSENTVRNHISNLYRKLGIQKRLDLVLLVQKYQGS